MLKLETNLMKTRYYREAREEAIKEGRQEGLEQGLQEGLEQGLNEGKRQMTEEIAKRMLEENLPIELIAKTTGLSKRKVQQLCTSKSSETNDRARKKQNSSALKTRRRHS